jgi:hypothetical protein
MATPKSLKIQQVEDHLLLIPALHALGKIGAVAIITDEENALELSDANGEFLGGYVVKADSGKEDEALNGLFKEAVINYVVYYINNEKEADSEICLTEKEIKPLLVPLRKYAKKVLESQKTEAIKDSRLIKVFTPHIATITGKSKKVSEKLLKEGVN